MKRAYTIRVSLEVGGVVADVVADIEAEDVQVAAKIAVAYAVTRLVEEDLATLGVWEQTDGTVENISLKDLN